MAHYLAIAADGDGTLTTRGSMSRRVVRSLQQLRDAGRKALLVTGEKLKRAEQFPHVHLFDRVVAENGAILFDPASGVTRQLCQSRPEDLLPALEVRVGCVSGGEVAIMCQTSQRKSIENALKQLGSDWRTVPNRGDLMILPPGISKATALGVALEELGIAPANVVAVGDAENDVPMLESCGLGAAVANATEIVKQVAHLVLNRKAGGGVAELIDRMLADDLPEPHVRRPCATALDDGGMHWMASVLQPGSLSRDAS